MADGRARPVAGVARFRQGEADPVDPHLEGTAADLVGVRLEVINHDEVGCGEAPDVAFPRTDRIGRIDLVDTPEVGRVPVQGA